MEPWKVLKSLACKTSEFGMKSPVDNGPFVVVVKSGKHTSVPVTAVLQTTAAWDLFSVNPCIPLIMVVSTVSGWETLECKKVRMAVCS